MELPATAAPKAIFVSQFPELRIYRSFPGNDHASQRLRLCLLENCRSSSMSDNGTESLGLSQRDYLKHPDKTTFDCLLEDMRDLAHIWRAGAVRLENAASELETLELEREAARR